MYMSFWSRLLLAVVVCLSTTQVSSQSIFYSEDKILAELESKEAYGRAAEVWEVANVMIFLASDYSSYMTGEMLSTSSQRA